MQFELYFLKIYNLSLLLLNITCLLSKVCMLIAHCAFDSNIFPLMKNLATNIATSRFNDANNRCVMLSVDFIILKRGFLFQFFLGG